MRMIRAFPHGRADDRPVDCPHTARELAWRFVVWERLAHYLLLGRSAATHGPVPASMTEILHAFESAHAETRLALLRLSHERWTEVVRGPVTAEIWERGRRGDLLWMAWKALIHHGEHFAAHLRLAREEEALARERARTAGGGGRPRRPRQPLRARRGVSRGRRGHARAALRPDRNST
jgi:hypothetical protein